MRDTKVMADRLAARTAGESRRGSTGRGMVARYLPGQEQTGPPKGGGRMRMLGGDSTGEATGSVGGGPSAQRPEGGCLPCRGGTQLAWRHWEDGW